MATVFVYGTLTDPDRAAAVLDGFDYAGAATLTGCHRVDAGEYPTLAPGGSVEGRLLVTADLAALDRYEGVDRGLYARVEVPLVGHEGIAQVYVGDPDRLGAGGAVEWPGDGSLAARVNEYVRAEDVVVRME